AADRGASAATGRPGARGARRVTGAMRARGATREPGAMSAPGATREPCARMAPVAATRPSWSAAGACVWAAAADAHHRTHRADITGDIADLMAAPRDHGWEV